MGNVESHARLVMKKKTKERKQTNKQTKGQSESVDQRKTGSTMNKR